MILKIIQTCFVASLILSASGQNSTGVCSLNNVCFALDQSGSIQSSYPQVQTFTVNAAREVDRRTTNTTYSAYGFAGGARTIQAPTKDLNGSFIPSVLVAPSSFGSTNMRAGLQACLDVLKGKPGNRTAVLVTDGFPTSGSPLSYKQAYQQEGIGLVTVGIGSSIDVNLLRRLASSPDFFVSATNSSELVAKAIAITDSLCQVVDAVVADRCAEEYKKCDFQFLGKQSVPTYTLKERPDVAFTARIVSKMNPSVGILNTNGIDVEFIGNDSISPITAFGMPRLVSTHFKPFSFAKRPFATGIGHQTFTGNQLAISRGRCVKVSFSSFQTVASNPSPRVINNVNNAKKSDNKCVVFKTA